MAHTSPHANASSALSKRGSADRRPRGGRRNGLVKLDPRRSFIARGFRMNFRLLAIAATAMVVVAAACPAAQLGGREHTHRYYVTGTRDDVVRPTSGLLVLQGGGDDVDENYRRMGERGGGGDFVVLRASGADEYDDYIFGLCHCASVATLVIDDRSASEDPFVIQTIRNAEALFIAG